MAKAITIVLLLAATAAFAAAHPGLGKGGILSNIVIGAQAQSNQTADFTKVINFSHGDKDIDTSHCDCKEDCKDEKKTQCEEAEKEDEVCKDEEKEEDIEVCEEKCFKADKVITVGHHGKGRRLLTADALNHGFLFGGKGADMTGKDKDGEKKEVCRTICKPETRKQTRNVCKKEKTKIFVNCVEKVICTRCVKTCQCGHKTITKTTGPITCGTGGKYSYEIANPIPNGKHHG